MTWDVLGRLLATCSSDRPGSPATVCYCRSPFRGEQRRSEVTWQPSIDVGMGFVVPLGRVSRDSGFAPSALAPS